MTYERGDKVLVKVDTNAWMRARILADTGGDEVVVVARRAFDPKRSQRVPRSLVRVDSAPEAPPQKKPTRRRDTRQLYCSESEHGLCALQRQARAPSRAEMAGGAWSLCGTWITSRSAPKKLEPTCPDCRRRLKME